MNKNILYNLGFSDKETEVYLALNHFGASPASTLARLTKVKRTSVYDALNVLIGKQLVTFYKQGSTTYYAIDDIKAAIAHARREGRSGKILVRPSAV